MSNCPLCGADGAYVGLTLVECPRKTCTNYVDTSEEPESRASWMHGSAHKMPQSLKSFDLGPFLPMGPYPSGLSLAPYLDGDDDPPDPDAAGEYMSDDEPTKPW